MDTVHIHSLRQPDVGRAVSKYYLAKPKLDVGRLEVALRAANGRRAEVEPGLVVGLPALEGHAEQGRRVGLVVVRKLAC